MVDDTEWVYEVLEMGDGRSYVIYDRATMKLVKDETANTRHFPTLETAARFAEQLCAKGQKRKKKGFDG